MTAPDPTAGEHVIEERGRVYDRCRCGWYGSLGDTHVAASTGTSEDEPNIIQRIVDAWDCCGTCAGGVLARHMAEERERIAQAIERERDARHIGVGGVTLGSAERFWVSDEPLNAAARIAREGR